MCSFLLTVKNEGNEMDILACNTRWTDEYLQQKMGSKELTVDITPHGVGDAVLQVQTNPTKKNASANNAATTTTILPLPSAQKVEEMFVKPLEQRMNMRTFFQVCPMP